MGQTAGDRKIHDADSHIMEIDPTLDAWLDPELRGTITGPVVQASTKGLDRDEARRLAADDEHRAAIERDVLGFKGWLAAGSFVKEDRPWALDLLGFTSQLVFTSVHLGPLRQSEVSGDLRLAYGVAAAHNRMMFDFCSVDDRLMPTVSVPLSDLDGAARFAQDAIDQGAAGLLLSSFCPPGHSISHVGLDGVWAAAQEAQVPILFHLDSESTRFYNADYRNNGQAPVKDFVGGDNEMISTSFMTINNPVTQNLAALIIDGTLERFPDLRVGAIELGASWMPGFMRLLDASATAFKRNEDRIRALSMKPSEYVQRQVRVTPYPYEPAGWIIHNTGPDVCMFSSDYPHIEGTRNPIERFDAALDEEACTADERDAFYWRNYEDLLRGPLDRAAITVGA
ncbi:MAG: amidohydrolase family protein [Ilumatobacteraceae bacterium]